ncbi:AMP-dependent synthetase and ligase [Leptothrix cholodnii SP-6]|uniref:AMP-dependent synthetase and ligase n=1 Tax=Leptothrix cholodnii (strain ATCC 51168 / LMG 8142 / SP-6) TaxID=395495 RepID=B1Y361_LEPCP|nr:feruloyl-CoA synthase [Leptothrix cholodnii]ACB33264.1 AMP-dependent synthetase and ligase [Leptothrix cholodnii SP-6]
MSEAIYRPTQVGGALEATLEVRPDGSRVLRSTEALRWFPERITDALVQWAEQAPDRTFVARRERLADGSRGDWQRVSYREMLQRAQSVGQALTDRGLSAERPVVILSDNDLEHMSLALGAMWAGIAYAPISAAYSLVSQDFGKLRHILDTLKPGLVFASGPAYGRAIAACVGTDVEVVLTEGTLDGRAVTPFTTLLETTPGASGAAAHDAVGPDTIAKFLFTSGSTKQPKGVINTHRMLCANQQMIRQCLAFLAEQPPVLVDWLPWNHTFGGNHNVGIALYNGGTLYIDEGKPTPAGIAETLRNLREISPTVYFNVPKGYEEIATAMDSDAALRERLFERVNLFMYAGAGLSQAIWDKLEAHGQATVGERVRMITSLGMTETAPACVFALGTDVRSGQIGLPAPGCEVKLVPTGDGPWDKVEVRFRGPHVMPGYWRAPEQTAEAFDAEGFYCTGDAVKFVDEAHPNRGLVFDGRIAEDFKLSTGTFVSVGPLRGRVVAAGDPCVQDAVVTGLNRDELGLLLIPRLDECRRLAGLPASTPAPEVLHHPTVRAFFQALADKLWRAGTGSANRVARLHVLAEPPSIDKGEITDKGSINQRAVLQHRAALVDALYEGRESDPFVILPNKN